MTAEVDRLIYKETGINPNLISNHIRCICHKIALILTAGLKAINTNPEGLTWSQKSTLGFVPALMPILEESGEKDNTAPTNTFASDDEELDEEVDQGLGKDTDLNKETKSPDNSSGSGQKLLAILKKIDFVIQRITSSASKRSEFDVWHKKLDKNGTNLIAGYGI